MNKRTLLPLAIAAVFALSGCAGSNDGAGDPSAPAGGKPSATTSAKAAPAKGAQLDDRSLREIAQGIAGENSNAQVVDGDGMRAQLPLVQQQMKTMKIEPAKCAAFVSADLSAEFDKMNMVNLVLPGESPVQSVQVSIASYAEPADAAASIAHSRKTIKDCSSFSMAVQGQTVEMKVSEIGAKTKAATTEAIRSVVSVPGKEIPTVAVNARNGRNLISVSVTGGSNEAADVDQAQDLVNSVLELIGEKAS